MSTEVYIGSERSDYKVAFRGGGGFRGKWEGGRQWRRSSQASAETAALLLATWSTASDAETSRPLQVEGVGACRCMVSPGLTTCRPASPAPPLRPRSPSTAAASYNDPGEKAYQTRNRVQWLSSRRPGPAHPSAQRGRCKGRAKLD